MPRKPASKKAVKAAQPQEEAKSAAGRKSLYRPEYAQEQKKLLMLGAVDQEIADYFGVAKSTLYEWRLRHQEFADSVLEGRQRPDMEVAFSAYEKATGKWITEEVPIKVKRITYDDKGKKIAEHEEVVVTEVRKFLPPDPTSIQFWLKNRKQVAWQDRKQVEVGSVGDFAKMEDEELLRYIQEEASEISKGLGSRQDESPGRVVAKGSDSRH